MLNPARGWRLGRTPLVSDWVPWEDWLDERAVLLSDGSACAWLEVEGKSAETANALDLNVWHEELNQALRQIATDRLVYTTLLCHGVHDDAVLPVEPCRIPFAADLRAEYRANLLRNSLYFNKLYVVLQYRPAAPAGEWIGDKIGRAAERLDRPAAQDSAADRAAQVERVAALLAEQLRDYKVRRLGAVRRDGRGWYNEIAEAQVFAATGLWREVGLTTGRMGNAMFSEDVTFHYEHVELRHPGGSTYAAHLGFKEYPAATWPGMLNGLLAANFRFTLCQSFRMMEQAEGQAIIGRKQNKMAWAGDKAFSQREGLALAADALQGGRFVMGDHNLTLCVFSGRAGGPAAVHAKLLDAFSRAGLPGFAQGLVEGVVDRVLGGPRSNGLADVVNAAWRVLGGCGCVVARENKAVMAAWLSLIAGNHRYRVRPGAISSRNYAAMNPLHGFARGAERSRWGAPIVVTRSGGGTPYNLHWHDGETDAAVGSTLITGETGSGKTTATGMMIACTAARILPQGGGVIGLDHKRGWNALFLAMGGNYAALGAGQPHLAPLKALTDTPRDREFINDLLVGCVRQGGWRDLHPEEERRLALGIATVMQNPPRDRWVREVQAFLGDEEGGAGARLRKWCWGEDLGWVIDAPEDRIDVAGDLNCYDTTRLMENKRARGAAITYLFYRIERRLDGRPLAIPIDEGWSVLLEEEAFRPAVDKSSRTIRSKNGILVFITQSPGDAVRSGISAALVEQFPNQMHFANPRAAREDYVGGLKRTDGEYEALMSLQKGTGQFLLCKGRESSVQQFPLAGMEDEIAVLSTPEAMHEAIDAMDEETRRDPGRFLAAYHAARRAMAGSRRQRQREFAA